jgi:hypothetical protein
MRPVINPAVLSVINPAASAARAMQPMRDMVARIEAALKPPAGLMESLNQLREVGAIVAPLTGLVESFLQIQQVETAVAPPAGLAESLHQIGEAVPTNHWDFAAPQMQSDREREQAAPITPVANCRVAPPAPAPSRKQNRGNRTVRPGTVAAAVALGLYVANRRCHAKLTPFGLAQLAADFAAEQGLEGADLLVPNGSTMRTLAAALLHGWKAMAKLGRLPPEIGGLPPTN